MWTTIQLAFAGFTSYIFHWGIGFGIIILCGLLYYFSASIPLIGPFLTKFRKDLLWVAAAAALVMFGIRVGNKDAAARCEAKQTIIERVVTKTVDDAKKSTTKDKWNSKDN